MTGDIFDIPAENRRESNDTVDWARNEAAIIPIYAPLILDEKGLVSS